MIAAPTSTTVNTPITLDGFQSYDPDGDSIIEYRWTIQKPGGTDTLLGEKVTYGWNQASSFQVTLTVTDSDGQTGTAGTTINVIGSCPLPTGESTAPAGWDALDGTEYQWVQTLNPSQTDFTGKTIKETDAGGVIDTCWSSSSALPQVTGITSLQSARQWIVAPGNEWGFDEVRSTPAAVAYYRQTNRAPCSFTVHQQMMMSCPDGTFQPYGSVNTLIGIIQQNSVTSCRAGHCASRRY